MRLGLLPAEATAGTEACGEGSVLPPLSSNSPPTAPPNDQRSYTPHNICGAARPAPARPLCTPTACAWPPSSWPPSSWPPSARPPSSELSFSGGCPCGVAFSRSSGPAALLPAPPRQAPSGWRRVSLSSAKRPLLERWVDWSMVPPPLRPAEAHGRGEASAGWRARGAGGEQLAAQRRGSSWAWSRGRRALPLRNSPLFGRKRMP